MALLQGARNPKIEAILKGVDDWLHHPVSLKYYCRIKMAGSKGGDILNSRTTYACCELQLCQTSGEDSAV